MYVLKTLMRAYTILNTCAAYRVDQFINPFIRRFWMRQFVLIILFLSNPRAYIFNSSKIKTTAKAVRCRKLLEDLGPVFVKFGQALSTRRDLIAEDFADQLRLLQDQVPPFPATQAISIIEAELGQKLTACFATFDSKPMASASVAQVHAARLKTGEEVVIKVIRPDIANTIKLDINLMLFFARLFLLLWPASRKLHLVAVIKDYGNTIHHELNLSREAANATQLRYHFQDSDLLYVPTIHWQYTTSKVMTMERIFGIPLTDIHALKTKGINLKKLAERGTEIFYTQVFHHAFFHADMHPGNIFVDPDRPDQPRYLGIDFGIMGSLAEEDQYYLAHNFLAFFRRDYKRVAALHIASGWVAEHTDLLEMEAAIRTVCEPIFARPLKDISFGRILIQLFHIARQFDMEVQPQLVLLQKTLLQVEGLGRQIYPDLNPWQTGQPILEQWLKQRVAPWHVMKRMIRKAPEWLDQLPDLPVKILAMLDHIEQQLDSMQEQSQKNKKSKHKSRAHYR